METEPKTLSIRSKIVISILILASILTFLIYIISNKIILNSYITLQNDVVSINIKRVNFALNNLKETQITKSKDWAFWDSSYAFIKDHNKEYIDDNLQTISLVNLNVNFMAFIDKDGNIIFDKAINLQNGEEINSEALMSFLVKQTKYINHPSANSLDTVVSGFMKTPNGLAFVSSANILSTEGKGPVNGVLILGNFLDENVTKRIGDSIFYPVTVNDYNGSLTDDMLIAQKILSANTKSFIYNLPDGNVAGYSLIYDLDNNPIAIAKIVLPRDFYNKGRNSFNIFTGMIFGVGLSAGFVILLLLEKLILRRFVRLNDEILEISKAKDLTRRIKIDKNDEIGNLTNVINKMLSELYILQEKEKESDKVQKVANDELKKHMEETEKINKLMVNRELAMIELKRKVEELEKGKTN